MDAVRRRAGCRFGGQAAQFPPRESPQRPQEVRLDGPAPRRRTGARDPLARRAGDEGDSPGAASEGPDAHEDRQVPHEPPPCGRTRRCFRLPSRPQHPIVQSRCEPPAGRRRLSYARHGAAWARWPSWSSKPVRSCNPRLGRFDSGAAPLSRNRVSKGILAVSEARLTPPRSALRRLGTS